MARWQRLISFLTKNATSGWQSLVSFLTKNATSGWKLLVGFLTTNATSGWRSLFSFLKKSATSGWQTLVSFLKKNGTSGWQRLGSIFKKNGASGWWQRLSSFFKENATSGCQWFGFFLKENATFFRLHFACFIIMSLVGSAIMWAAGTENGGHFGYVDCLYGIISALCLSGLTTIPMEDWPILSQVVLFIAMTLGSQVFTSIVPLLVKKHRYYNVAKVAVEPIPEEGLPPAPTLAPPLSISEPSTPAPPFSRSEPFTVAPPFSRSEPSTAEEEQQPPAVSPSLSRRGSQMLQKLGSTLKRNAENEAWMAEMAAKQDLGYLKDIFHEHQATVLLIRIIVGYMIVVQMLGFSIFMIIIMAGRPYTRRLIRQKRSNVGFFSLFSIVSGFCNVGYILVNENMLPFNTSLWMLVDMTIVIVLGNALYPPCLRGIIWLLHRYSKGSSREAYGFLLNNPRRCYTHLFPPKATLWLIIATLCMNTFEVAVLYILDWNSGALAGLSWIGKIINGIFQCVNTRSGGMNSLNIVALSPTTLFIFAVMMYISAYPVFLSRQYTRQKSGEEEAAISHLSPQLQRDLLDTTVSTQLRRLLVQDTAYLFLGTFLICCSVNHDLKHDPLNYNLFSVLFEIVSAYCGVGLSYGYSCSLKLQPGPCVDKPVSLSGKWGVTGKLLLCLIMLIGRHRGLPDNIDSAILLPEQKFGRLIRRQAE